jgi:release factor glutamine methyltransferase
MPASESWTIGRLLQWTVDYLKQHQSDSPRLDAEVLLAHAAGCQRIELYTRFDVVADDALRDAFRSYVKQRAAGTPVAYLVGHREFYSHDFRVTPDVLIPRPETEFVVISLLDEAKRSGRLADPLRIADVGTGSGVLAICAAIHLPQSHVTAIDISPAALTIARANAERHQVAERIRFLEGNLLDPVPAAETFDMIVSNPPYIGLSERDDLPRDVRDHEPALALFAGTDGLDVLRPLIAAAAKRLVPGGWLMAEFSPPQQSALREIVAQDDTLESPLFTEDLNQRPRVLRVRRAAT